MTHTEANEKPKFDLVTRQFSDEEFRKHLSFFNLKIDFNEFSLLDDARLTKLGITKYWQLLSAEGVNIDTSFFWQYFPQYRVLFPIVFTAEQLAQLK